MYRNSEGWRKLFEDKKAFWVHDGNPKRPHALMTFQKHSNGFFNSRVVIDSEDDEDLLRDAAYDLIELFIHAGGDLWYVGGVVGPKTGATRLAEFICHQAMDFTKGDCFWSSPAVNEADDPKLMMLNKKGLETAHDRKILLCEDVISTGMSVKLTAKIVTDAGGIALPYVLALVNRSGLDEIDGRKIIALVDEPMPAWTPDECELCKIGSIAIRPKNNWDLFSASY